MIVERGDPRDPQVTALLQASHALMESLFPPEENNYLSIDALCAPEVHFFVARDGETLLGCGAVKHMGTYGELKSMFTAGAARGKGAASAILDHIVKHTRALGLTALKLETGKGLDAAHRLYAKHGFTPCGPFGDYEANKTSLFMEKPL
ncbi:putative acetyltransferase [Litoreibacter ascidiaceicola]|uniref:Putative acetyltransferase n=1 Tax=Litoreibacter ascidiaceicola TaxID=1486859 RepID=A0A1M5AM57_9RHOB|nr:GNAT family N-acetyltransferase [Litoreibacter ascidiaceicola]SHF31351.1 putative acetyltransferase [Litoreibacter ascidiaceicola]